MKTLIRQLIRKITQRKKMVPITVEITEEQYNLLSQTALITKSSLQELSQIALNDFCGIENDTHE